MNRAVLTAVLILLATSAFADLPYVYIAEYPTFGGDIDFPVNEGRVLNLTIYRGGDTSGTITANVFTDAPIQRVDSRYRGYPAALPGIDYVVSSPTTFTWLPGDTSTRSFSITMINDDIPEPTKAFAYGLSAYDDAGHNLVGNGPPGHYGNVVAIFDDGDLPALSISGSTTVSESAGSVSFVVTPNAAGTKPYSVQFNTSFGTALEGIDFVPMSGSLSWDANDATARTFTVGIVPRTGINQPRAFSVWLTTPANATVATASASVTIADDPSLVGVPGRRRAVRKN